MQKQVKQAGDHRGKHGGQYMRPGKSVAVDGEPGQRDLDIEQGRAPHRGAEPDQHQIDGEGRQQAHQRRPPHHAMHSDPVERHADKKAADREQRGSSQQALPPTDSVEEDAPSRRKGEHAGKVRAEDKRDQAQADATSARCDAIDGHQPDHRELGERNGEDCGAQCRHLQQRP